jgi:WD40 repeat protein
VSDRAAQKPIILKGHDRPVSQVLFNREGDLLFTASKGKTMNCAVWRADTGERIGTYDGHNGAIFCMDIDCRSFLNTARGILTSLSPFKAPPDSLRRQYHSSLGDSNRKTSLGL